MEGKPERMSDAVRSGPLSLPLKLVGPGQLGQVDAGEHADRPGDDEDAHHEDERAQDLVAQAATGRGERRPQHAPLPVRPGPREDADEQPRGGRHDQHQRQVGQDAPGADETRRRRVVGARPTATSSGAADRRADAAGAADDEARHQVDGDRDDGEHQRQLGQRGHGEAGAVGQGAVELGEDGGGDRREGQVDGVGDRAGTPRRSWRWRWSRRAPGRGRARWRR